MNNFSDRVVERMQGRATAGTIIELAIAEGQDLSDAAREAYLEMLDTTFGIGIKEIVPPEIPTPMDDVEARRYAANERVPYFPEGASLVGNVSNYELHRRSEEHTSELQSR